jgi:hypothetical protein
MALQASSILFTMQSFDMPGLSASILSAGTQKDGEEWVEVQGGSPHKASPAQSAGSSGHSLLLRVVLILGVQLLAVAAYLWWRRRHTASGQGYLPVVQMHAMPADGYSNGIGSSRQGRHMTRTPPV